MKNSSKSLYKSHGIIYTDPVPGYYNNIRLFCMSLVAFLFFILPWITWNKKQAILFDLSTARFYFFKYIFWPEDFYLFSILIIISVLFLFTITVYIGRVWCGFFCPQSIWLKFISFITRILEGNRNKRKKQDNEKKNFLIFFKKNLKQIFFLFFSFITSFTFVSYFVPLNFLISNFLNFNLKYWSFFWILFFGFLTYFNIVWFREQLCFLVCPYARLQSVMFDENTLIVGYDRDRGEKRGSRKKGFDYKSVGLGDCIDCMKCVTCCPTGIDIRNGLQMECISCAACIDACDDVMKKMSYKKGLIRYMRESEITGKKKEISSKVRLFSYSFFLFFLLSIFIFLLSDRALIHFNVTRSQLQLYNIKENNSIENVYIIKVTNKTQEKHNYKIFIEDTNFEYIGINNIYLDKEDTVLIDVKLIYNGKINSRFYEIFFKVICLDDDNIKPIIKKSKFVMPF